MGERTGSRVFQWVRSYVIRTKDVTSYKGLEGWSKTGVGRKKGGFRQRRGFPAPLRWFRWRHRVQYPQ
ncbi:hypothetical protein CCHR01_17749 [Colletotrichum chrysophilum]|uniref:Uncharacterized protein n=1 Tax=Colletotrichum chrysophilum TaxID=1836956 RepID=A0AAD9E6L3_9PEZI|nr:hypothetical protein CCHR01_17749 [Colletotrichum chrysophilum]